ncbi:hypothetical protein [Actinomadura sp. 9N407]|uniref:hypothetical protein n=1 Tax=Actinomadura sp. 9N407 TaxID=3375154 RepID=UPI0037962BF9
MEPRNKREAQLLELMQKKPARWYAGRSGRRRLVWIGVALLGLLWVNAGVSWTLAPSNVAMITCFVILGVVLLAGIVLWQALLVGTRGTVGLPEHLLDERQRGDRLRAHAIAHRLTLLLIFITFFVVMQALPDADYMNEVPSAAAALLFMALLFTTAALPTLVAAWQVPDPPDDDDEDEDAGA